MLFISFRCRYQHQYENVVYICKQCHGNGNEVIVTSRTQTQNDNSWYGLAKYAWAGYVIECPQCGEIYRSRQYWYGNKNPEDVSVRSEITHVWSTVSVKVIAKTVLLVSSILPFFKLQCFLKCFSI